MYCVHTAVMGLIAATTLVSGSVAADTPAERLANAAPVSNVQRVNESIEADAVRGNVAAGKEIEKSQGTHTRFRVRVHLDDGRYQGFHQHGGDELRVGDPVQVETDRLHRAQPQDRTRK